MDAGDLRLVVSAFDQMGDVAVIRIPPELYDRRHTIGDALLYNIKAVRAVFCQISDVSGEYRTRRLERIAGEGGTVTEYVENGCRFAVDVEKVFFTPRLSTERMRVARLAQPGETILNMFGGAGLYSIQIARRIPCVVYNLDINPEAGDFCARSVRLNRLAGSVVPITADAINASHVVPNKVDRTIMPLPERSAEFAAVAVDVTCNDGIIHYYSHVHADRKQDAVDIACMEASKTRPCHTSVLYTRLVRAVGPRYYQTVVDIRIHK